MCNWDLNQGRFIQCQHKMFIKNKQTNKLPFILRHKHAVVFCLSVFTKRILALVTLFIMVYYNTLILTHRFSLLSTCFHKIFTNKFFTIDTIHCFWTHKTFSSYLLSKVSFKMLSADNMNHNWSNVNSSCTHE